MVSVATECRYEGYAPVSMEADPEQTALQTSPAQRYISEKQITHSYKT